MKQVLPFLTLLLCFAACKVKEEPNDMVGSPVFYVAGTIDGKPVTLSAGKDTYHMYSSSAKSNDDVYTFNADIRTRDCINCKSAFHISVRNYKPGAAFSKDSAFVPNLYSFLDPT